jgi:hypothetical protein
LTIVTPADSTLRPLYAATFALIRPDQHVCWRGDVIPNEAEGLLLAVCGRQPQDAPARQDDPQHQTA